MMAESHRGHPRKRRSLDRERVFRLRDSLIYRAEAIAWHAHLLSVLQTSANRRLEEAFHDREKEVHLLMLAGREQHYAFDDLVFNAISLFDYIANLIGFTIYGDRRRKAKWDRIQKFARDVAYDEAQNDVPRLSGTRVSQSVLNANSALVERLSDYRAALIHYEALVGKGDYTFKLGDNPDNAFGVRYDLRFRVPEEFVRLFAVPPSRDDPSKFLLLDAAHWLVNEVNRHGADLLLELRRDLRSEAGLEPDGRDGVVEIVT